MVDIHGNMVYHVDMEAIKGASKMNETIKAMAEMFESKYNEALANGATEEQAIKACRLLWLEAIK